MDTPGLLGRVMDLVTVGKGQSQDTDSVMRLTKIPGPGGKRIFIIVEVTQLHSSHVHVTAVRTSQCDVYTSLVVSFFASVGILFL